MLIEKTQRFLALDVFRGLTICLMILVNTPGTGAKIYPYLSHADWFGFTLADLIFPSFLFAMGNAMSFSMRKFKDAPSQAFWKKVVRRTVLIFLFGFLMYWYPFFEQGTDGLEFRPFSETRVMGVLQRIALCYFIASVLLYFLSEKATLIVSGLILLGYWAILYLFGVPGGELDMATNAGTLLDFAVLGEGHVYKGDRMPFDPEGLLSTLPSTVNVIGGYFAGSFLQKKGVSFESIAKLLIAGGLVTVLALWWDLIFPIGKKLWTSSFTLYTIGIDLSVLAVLVYFIEIKKWRFGVRFFDIFGKNPLFIYLFSELLLITLSHIPVTADQNAFEWISEVIFQTIFPGSLGSFMTAFVFMLVCWALGWWLHKKRVYIKI
ncbi:acyltransferase family protein [Pareuzebyella sediminis]|uniref:acyltransferase family protein n=1 Tax=Pareuzebyella sediminis TaxID=2607998 RepID=UPI001E406419|nr:heparan-alpha-glucosaminide N-acetyltransferase domain-containing protein [Pareuzebyella sediminis]